MAPKKKPSTAEQRRMLDKGLTDDRENAMRMNALAHMTKSMQALPHHAQLELFGEEMKPMVDYREELVNHGGGWPVGLDSRAARAYLDLSFHQCQSLPYGMEMVFGQDDYEPSPGWLMMRLNDPSPFSLMWYMTSEVGDVCPEEPVVGCMYPSIVRHNFADMPYRNESFHAGKTHVAVGFVDLGFLLPIDLKCSEDGPLRFVGYDPSAFAVAKTLVVWEMLTQKNGDGGDISRCVMQVWFSSTWDQFTYEEFKSATSRLVNGRGFGQRDTGIKKLLRYWATTSRPVPIIEARKQWMALHMPGDSLIAHLVLRRDRIAMTRYELTGDFGLAGDPFCGSITMFDCPDGTPPSVSGESVFAALDPDPIIKDNLVSIVASAENYVLSGITRMREWAQSGKLTVELHCKAVDHSVKEIAALRPSTMSWSNLMDYFNSTMFHVIARGCSTNGGTVHFGYSMNWISRVKGTSSTTLTPLTVRRS